MIQDVYFKIHRETGPPILAEWVETDWANANQLTRGETATFNFHFGNLDDLVVTGTYTVASGAVEQYDTITVQSGATLTINGELYGDTLTNNGTVDNNGTLTLYGDVFGEITDYGDYAGGFAPVETLDSNSRYAEQIPSNADVDSILVGIEPSQRLQDNNIPGVWGIINRTTDTRPRSFSDTTYEMELIVLAEYGEYSTHTAAETDLIV